MHGEGFRKPGQQQTRNQHGRLDGWRIAVGATIGGLADVGTGAAVGAASDDARRDAANILQAARPRTDLCL